MTIVHSATLDHGDEIIPYEMVVRPARKTLGIHVHPDGRVRVLVPAGLHESTVKAALLRRADWISRHLKAFSIQKLRVPPRQYLNGELHPYLGDQYRLQLMPRVPHAGKKRVELTRTEILISSSGDLPPEKVKDILQGWYRERILDMVGELFPPAFDWFERQGFAMPKLSVRVMRTRWGSLSPAGRMSLNALLAQTPKPCIEYVIVHEFCHLVHRNHGPDFYALLEQRMPDWKACKQRLKQFL